MVSDIVNEIICCLPLCALSRDPLDTSLIKRWFCWQDLPLLRIPCSGPQGEGPCRGVQPAKPKCIIFYLEFFVFLLLSFFGYFSCFLIQGFAVPVPAVHILAGLPCSFFADGYLSSYFGRCRYFQWEELQLGVNDGCPFCSLVCSPPLVNVVYCQDGRMKAECVPVLVRSESSWLSEERGCGKAAWTSVHGLLVSTVCLPSA